MLYAIDCTDAANATGLRTAHYDAHRAYLYACNSVRVLLAGPRFTEDGTNFKGSLLIVEARSIDAVREFSRADPFTVNGIWKFVAIDPFVAATNRFGADSPSPV